MDCQCKPDVMKKIDNLQTEIYGNGNSNNSLVTRMARVETNMKLLLGRLHYPILHADGRCHQDVLGKLRKD